MSTPPSPPVDELKSRKKTLPLVTMKRIALGLPNRIGQMGQSGRSFIEAVINGERRPFRLQRTRSGTALTTEPEILPAMNSMWREKALDELPVAKDIPRLARRVIVQDESEHVLYESLAAAADEDTSLKRSLELTSDLILSLLEALEGLDRANAFRPIMKEIVQSANESSDAEHMCRQLIALLGDESNSATVRALKCVHQDIVGHCTFQLKQHITSRFMTKDVRTPEGWRIILKVAPEFFQVSHTRREQSIDPMGDKTNHWEFEWELRLMFDSKVNEMRHAQLRVTDLFLSSTIDPQLEEAIKHDLLGGEVT
jgi:hypothetical protein